MNVQIQNPWIGKHPADLLLDSLFPFQDFRGQHKACRVIAPNGKQSMPYDRRQLIHSQLRRFGILAHKDWPTGPIRRFNIVMGVRQKKHTLSDLCVFQTHPAWKARFLIGNHPPSAVFAKFPIVHREKRGKRFRRKSTHAKVYRLVHGFAFQSGKQTLGLSASTHCQMISRAGELNHRQTSAQFRLALRSYLAHWQ